MYENFVHGEAYSLLAITLAKGQGFNNIRHISIHDTQWSCHHKHNVAWLANFVAIQMVYQPITLWHSGLFGAKPLPKPMMNCYLL